MSDNVKIKLIRAGITDAERIWNMQIRCFQEQYKRYQDHDTNPANEPVSKVQDRLKQPETYYYIISVDETDAGAIRVVNRKDGSPKLISPLFILPEFRGNGIGGSAVRLAEAIHGESRWELAAVMQEQRNLRFYESLGYRRTGKTQKLNDRITLIYFEK